jgi:drug/metabolite transporter (DMT)-like permease
MWKNATFATLATMCVIGMLIFAKIDFLIPYKRQLLLHHGRHIGIYIGLLAVNLFALYMILTRKLLLKDTGEKLPIMESQIRADSLVRDIEEHVTEDV